MQMLLTTTEAREEDGSSRKDKDGNVVKQPVLRFSCQVRPLPNVFLFIDDDLH